MLVIVDKIIKSHIRNINEKSCNWITKINQQGINQNVEPDFFQIPFFVFPFVDAIAKKNGVPCERTKRFCHQFSAAVHGSDGFCGRASFLSFLSSFSFPLPLVIYCLSLTTKCILFCIAVQQFL